MYLLNCGFLWIHAQEWAYAGSYMSPLIVLCYGFSGTPRTSTHRYSCQQLHNAFGLEVSLQPWTDKADELCQGIAPLTVCWLQSETGKRWWWFRRSGVASLRVDKFWKPGLQERKKKLGEKPFSSQGSTDPSPWNVASPLRVTETFSLPNSGLRWKPFPHIPLHPIFSCYENCLILCYTALFSALPLSATVMCQDKS